MVRLPFVKRKKVFLIQLARRGSRRTLGTVKASDPQEAIAKLNELLERYNGDDEVARYSTIIVIDAESGTEMRFKNPLFQGEEEQVPKSSRSKRLEELAEALQLNLVVTITKSVADTMAEGMKAAMGTMAKAMAGVVEEAVKTPMEIAKKQLEVLYEMQAARQQPRGPSLGELASFIHAMVELARHKDDVARLVGEALSTMQRVERQEGE